MKQKNNMEFNQKNKCNYVGIDDATEYAESIKNNVGADDSVRPILKRNTQKGITLVALVITIIVLLILAVVSIKIVFDGGLITKTSDAIEVNRAAQVEELKELWKAEKNIAKYENSKMRTLEELLNDMEIKKLITSTEKGIILKYGKVTIADRTIDFTHIEENEQDEWYQLSEAEKRDILEKGYIVPGRNESKSVYLAARYNNSEEIVEYIIAIFTKDDKFAGILLANNNIAVTYYTDEIYNVTGQETNEIKETYNWYEYGENGFEQTEQYKGKCVVSIDDFSKGVICEEFVTRIIESFDN